MRQRVRNRKRAQTGKRMKKSPRRRKSQRTKTATTERESAPTFTVKLAEDGAHYVLMDGPAHVPAVHIGNFISESKALAWIRDESAAWLAKWRSR